jgi:hypothetical protein
MKDFPKLAGFIALLLCLLSCEPVIAIGWEELLAIVILIAILLGPLLLRLYRLLDKIQKANQSEEKKKK